ncbi:hypothetical protein ACIQD2_13885 [Dietzia maris]
MPGLTVAAYAKSPNVNFEAVGPDRRNTLPQKISYIAEGFNQRVLPQDTGEVPATEQDLFLAAASMGDSSIFGGPPRSHYELVWRIHTIRFALETRGADWLKSESYSRLDASEKSGVSYFLGMVQASFMATELLKIENVVHVDAVLRLRGVVPRKSRPDLVGYQNRPSSPQHNGRALIEAKGRTAGFADQPLSKAKEQLRSAPSEVLDLVARNHLSVASLAHFSNGVWTSHLMDPPSTRAGTREVDDSVFRGLVNLASLLPVADAIDDLRRLAPGREDSNSVPGMTRVSLPLVETIIGMPTQLLEEIRAVVPAPNSADKEADFVVDDSIASTWSEGIRERRQRAEGVRGSLLDFRPERSFALSADGVLVEPAR